MNVVFRISGREAIPVRAIPYMAGTTVSADILVRGLLSVDPINPLHGLSAYELLNYDVCRKVSPWEWSRFAIELQALTDRLNRQERDGELTTAECTAKWKQNSVKLLPAQVFLWKDEFQAEHIKSYRRLSSEELVKSSADWIARMNELISSPDDSYTAELMDAQGAPENWREVIQEGIDARAADRPFKPEQFYAYAPNWSAPKDTDTPTHVTFTPMIDQVESAAVMEGFEEAITASPTSENASTTRAEDGGELVQILSEWFDKPLSELPKQQQDMAELYIPRWLELSAVERRACAIASGMAAQDAMRRGFNKVVRERAGERNFESKTEEANLLDDRCIEFAQMPELEIAEWIELTGVSLGEIGPYLVTPDSVGFVRWEPEEIRTYPKEFQVDMLRRNKHEPLKFPCTPARLLDFIDSEFSETYGCFEVPAAFRQAVAEGAQITDGTPLASRPGVASKTKSRPLPQQRHQEQEILRVIVELGYEATALPKWIPGGYGVKAEVRGKLKLSEKVFNLAWERLRAGGIIQDKA